MPTLPSHSIHVENGAASRRGNAGEGARMNLGRLSILLAGIATLLFPGQASASVIYTYTGNNFDTIFDPDPPSGTYTTSMSVTGFFTLDSPLAASLPLTNIFGDVQTFSFNDGRATLTHLDTLAIFAFRVSTGASPQIVDWEIQLRKGSLVAVGD